MKVRKARLQDLQPLSHLFDEYRQFYQQTSNIEAAIEFIKQRLSAEDSTIFIVENGEKLLGFTQLYPSFSSVSMQGLWVLNDLYVAADARQHGVAKKLMNAADQWARSTASKGLILETDKDNFKAQKLYEKLGYIKQDSTYHYFLSALNQPQT